MTKFALANPQPVIPESAILDIQNGIAVGPHLKIENRRLSDGKGSAYSEAFFPWPSWP